jgi:hypothetical protein
MHCARADKQNSSTQALLQTLLPWNAGVACLCRGATYPIPTRTRGEQRCRRARHLCRLRTLISDGDRYKAALRKTRWNGQARTSGGA